MKRTFVLAVAAIVTALATPAIAFHPFDRVQNKRPMALASPATSVASQTSAPRDGTSQQGVSVSGRIEDQTGAVIPDATISLTRTESGEVRETQANDSGEFSFEGVPPGTYVIKGSVEGFRELESTVTIGTQALAGMRVRMGVGIEEAVTVTAEQAGASIEQDRNADLNNFDDELLRELPLPTRSKSIYDFVSNFLSPAAQGTDELTVLVDGAETNSLALPTFAIRRVLINRNPYSAEYRRPGKARIEIITQDGSRRRFHGGLGFSYRNSALDARNAFAERKQDAARRFFEGSFSGPLVRRRASFFVSAERLGERESEIVNAFTLAGPFVQNLVQPSRAFYFLGRTDFRFNDSHRLSVRYDSSREITNNIGVGGFRLAEQGVDERQREHHFQLSLRSTPSARLLNDARFLYERENNRVGDAVRGATIEVEDAFTGGPSQVFERFRGTLLEFQNIANYYRGRHSLRFGGRLRPKFLRVADASNFGGTFEFADLNRFAAAAPAVFRINQGDPNISFAQHEADLFFQDEVKLRSNFSVTLGMRYDVLSTIDDYNNFAPRLAIAYAPGGGNAPKTVIRGGVGIFYERLPERVTQRSLLLNGERIRESVITNPAFPDPFEAGAVTQPPPSVVRIAPGLRTPYLTQAGISLEHQIRPGWLLTAEYATLHGFHLFRTRNINAPLPGASARPDSSFLNINQVESSATSRSNALSFTLRARLRKLFKGTAVYTLSRSNNDTSGAEPGAGFPFSLPANNYDLRSEYGRADYDQRHRFNLAGTFDLPLQTRLGAILSLASGVPFDITTGFDDNGDTVLNDRPLGVTRNTGQGPGLARLDLRFTKTFGLWRPFNRDRPERQNFEINIDAFNVLNHVNLADFVGSLRSPFFGRANAARPGRTLQISTKYSF